MYRLIIIALATFLLAAPGVAATNAIVAENNLSGTPQSTWDLLVPGSTTLQGFTTDISVNHGSVVNFKIQSQTASWRIDIYRLGYYQGSGARLVASIPMTGAKTQPAPITNAATGEVDAGNWSITTSWSVPSNAVSGVYLAKLVDLTNAANQNHIPFIVRADESHSDIVFQTSDLTWQAYNGWGGANLYGGNGPGTDTSPGRAYKVSYNRPIATRDGVGVYAAWTDFLFGAEFAAISWFEQNGYDISYIAGVDTSRSPSLLLNHKVFTSTGHDEYWDSAARINIEVARSSGLNLMFMSGNEVYWKTRFEVSLDGSATPHRTLVCYKETRANTPIDPLDVNPNWTWTGTWRDPRFSPPSDGGRPENGLTGTMFQVDSYRSDSIQVPASMSKLRFWRNTPNVSKTPVNGVTTLTENILGYEWDIAPDNGADPKGLINLSSTSVSVNSLLRDYGSYTGDGTAVHNLTLYKDPTSGALVFGAGTVFWAWGLSSQHDGPTTPTDPDVQQATVNILADMHVQPASLQAPLIAASASTDVTAPVSKILSPASGASFVEGQTITVSGSATDVGGLVAGVEISLDNGSTWRRATGTSNWSYSWTALPGLYTLLSRATDDSLNTESPITTTQITVTAQGATIFVASPLPDSLTTDDGNSLELGVKFSSATTGYVNGVRFYKNPLDLGAHVANLWDNAGRLVGTATFAAEAPSGWQEAKFASPIAIVPGATYTASYHTSGFYTAAAGYFTSPIVKGNLSTPTNAGVYLYSTTSAMPTQTYNYDNYWVDVTFTAGQTPPVVISGTSANAIVGRPFSYTISAISSPTSFNATGLPPGLSVNKTTGVISGTPTTVGTSVITLTATNGIGSGQATLTLSVLPAGSTLSIFSASSTPALVTVNDPNGVELGMKFTSSVAGIVSGVRFYKGPQNVGVHTGELWDSAGNLLATTTFTNETASGWQSATFASPVTISANSTYVVSYHTNGFYSATGNYFNTSLVNLPLSAPDSVTAGGNGVYVYGSAAAFPSNSYNATNYWVDVSLQ